MKMATICLSESVSLERLIEGEGGPCKGGSKDDKLMCQLAVP